MKDFEFISVFMMRSSKQVNLTRDEIVRSTSMGSKSATSVWLGKDIKISYYFKTLKLLVERTKDPRYKYTKRQLVEAFVEAIMEEVEHI